VRTLALAGLFVLLGALVPAEIPRVSRIGRISSSLSPWAASASPRSPGFAVPASPRPPAVSGALSGSGRVAARLKSYRALRYEGVVGQSSWHACGPAVLATYLTYYVGQETSEAEMIELITGAGSEGAPAGGAGAGASLLDLKRALAAKGIAAAGYRVDAEALLAYFQRGGPPLILHVTRPQHHFLLAIGPVPGKRGGAVELLVADPSYGRRLVRPEELESHWGFLGYVLVPVPLEPLLRRVQERQVAALAREGERLRFLQAVGRWGV